MRSGWKCYCRLLLRKRNRRHVLFSVFWVVRQVDWQRKVFTKDTLVNLQQMTDYFNISASTYCSRSYHRGIDVRCSSGCTFVPTRAALLEYGSFITTLRSHKWIDIESCVSTTCQALKTSTSNLCFRSTIFLSTVQYPSTNIGNTGSHLLVKGPWASMSNQLWHISISGISRQNDTR